MRELAATTGHAVDLSRPAPTPVAVPLVGRVPRICKLLAFAHHLDAQIRSGVYDDMADAARRLGLSRGRLTQILGLTLLCPAVQSGILSLPPVNRGRDPVTERTLRPIVAEPVWGRQTGMWQHAQETTRTTRKPI